MERKPDAYTRRFIEWAYFHGCNSVMMKYDNEDEWKPMKTNNFNWKACNYKINNPHHKNYFEKLYCHGTN